jgi:tetratricopeptide (TPR) repeat protein
MNRLLLTGALTVLAVASPFAQTQSQAERSLARGKAMWDQRLAKSAITALELAAKDKATAAEAHEMLGRIYTFRGWQQDNVFPGWHDEPGVRVKAIAELKASLAVDPNRTSAQDALKTAEGFAAAAKVDPAPPRPEITELDRKIANFAADHGPKADADEFFALLDQRIRAQADPAPYFTGAQIAIEHGQFDRGIKLAEQGVDAANRFVDENLSAYQMAGKADGSRTRARAQAADLVGWAAFQQKNYAQAAAKLEEAERLSRGLDFNNQLHLAELAKAQNETDRARDHYLNVLSLAGGFGGAPQPVRDRARQQLQAVYRGSEPFDAWLDTQLASKGDERKQAALKSLVDKKLPKLKLTTVDGKPFDAASLQGKVLLLNFFASW